MNRYYLILFLSVIAVAACFQPKADSINSYFEQLHTDQAFNGNVLIVQSDSIIYKNSFGFAKGDKSEKLTESHLFQVGSIYKEFPAVAIMQLKERGLLTLDDKLAYLVKGLPDWTSQITVKQLLQYSSGLPLVDWNSLFQEEGTVSLKLVLNKIHAIKKLEFTPGSDYLYSNYNPFMLIQIIEAVSQLDYEQYLAKHIFVPYNITGVITTNHYRYINTKDHSFAYPFNEDFEEDGMTYELPSICASTQGMYQWLKLVDNFEIVSAASVKQLSEVAITGDNIQAPLGRGDWKDEDLQLHLHHGSTGNYECLVRHYKSEDLYIILLTNQKHRNLHDIADEILDRLVTL